MVDETRFTDVMAVNGDHVEGDEIADGTSNYPTFEGRSGPHHAVQVLVNSNGLLVRFTFVGLV